MTTQRRLPEQLGIPPPIKRRATASQTVTRYREQAEDDTDSEEEIWVPISSQGHRVQPAYRYQEDVEALEDYSRMTHVPRSAIRYRTTRTQEHSQRQLVRQDPRHVARYPTRTLEEEPPEEPQRRSHWLVFVGLSMLAMLVGWMLLSLLLTWWQTVQDDWHYGRPRTFQVDTVVGHNDSATNLSHFIALNLNRHIEIIEIPGGDASKAKIYLGPVLIGQGQDLAAVTLSFKDVNGDGKPDLIVTIQDSKFVFINENGAFRPARPDEHIQL